VVAIDVDVGRLLTSAVQAEEQQPELPSLLQPRRVRRLVQQIEPVSGSGFLEEAFGACPGARTITVRGHPPVFPDVGSATL
jgi:hypothetical protein